MVVIFVLLGLDANREMVAKVAERYGHTMELIIAVFPQSATSIIVMFKLINIKMELYELWKFIRNCLSLSFKFHLSIMVCYDKFIKYQFQARGWSIAEPERLKLKQIIIIICGYVCHMWLHIFYGLLGLLFVLLHPRLTHKEAQPWQFVPWVWPLCKCYSIFNLFQKFD